MAPTSSSRASSEDDEDVAMKSGSEFRSLSLWTAGINPAARHQHYERRARRCRDTPTDPRRPRHRSEFCPVVPRQADLHYRPRDNSLEGEKAARGDQFPDFPVDAFLSAQVIG